MLSLTLDPLPDLTMADGTAVYVNLDATQADSSPLTFTASASDTTLVTHIPDDAANRSLRLNVDSPDNGVTGSMEFQLFEELAPLATERIATLANDGFYDGITFHRVIDDFMIQSGDPTGTGSGGSDLGDFDDQFDPMLMHTVPGVLSMANAGDDTNDSQFFITETPTRWLDFNHTVFGYLTRGEDVREAISNVPVDANDQPLDDVVINSAEVFTDYEDGVLILRAPDGFTGDVDVTVTVDDGNGGTAAQTFTVTVEEDTEDSSAYLGEISPIETTVDTPVTVTLPAVDVDGGDLYFDAQVWPENENITFDIVHETGELTVTPSGGISGEHSILVGVWQYAGSSWDTQLVPIVINSSQTIPVFDPVDPQTIPENTALEFSAHAEDPESPLTYSLVGAPAGAEIDADTGEFSWTPTEADGPGDFTFQIAATDTMGGTGSVEVTVHVTEVNQPPALDPIGDKTVAQLATLSFTAAADDEDLPAQSMTFSLTGAPTGAGINPTTGEFTWTPSETQVPGDYTFAVNVSDGALSDSETITVTVEEAGDAPVLDPLPDVTMYAGTAYYINLGATDADVLFDGTGEQLTYSVSVDDDNLEWQVPDDTINQSLRLNVESPGNGISGSMEFQLFEEIAPLATARIIELTEDGFYDDIIFHRVIDEFMIQSGDPTGTGSGGSDLGDFDDQFSPWAMHTLPGVLSMANAGDDTNDSQFFITETPTRWLDFNHTVFGYLTHGEDIREAISNVPVDANDQPEDDVVITSAEIFTDYEDGVLILRAPDGFTGDVDVTVTVDDGNGGTAQRTFTVTVEEDMDDSYAYLDEIDPIEAQAGETVTVWLPGIDIDSDDFYYGASIYSSDFTYDLDDVTGELTITVADVAGGMYSGFVGVNQYSGWDTQIVPIFITPNAPTDISLAPNCDTGIADDDGLTTEYSMLPFTADGVVPGFTVEFWVDGTLIDEEVVADGESSVTFLTNPADFEFTEGIHEITVKQTMSYEDEAIGNETYTRDFESAFSDTYTLTVDLTAPVFTSTPADETIASGVAYEFDVNSNDETAGTVRYGLKDVPGGLTIEIDETTGVITWTPNDTDNPTYAITIVATDDAGNETEYGFDLTVDSPPVFDAVGDQTVDALEELTFAVTATDPDATAVTYALGDDAPDGMTIDPSTGEIRWTPTEAQGTGSPITFTVTATDEFDSVGFANITVTASGPDGAPTLADLSDVTLSAGAPMYIVLDGYDPEDALTYTVSCDNAQISTLVPDDADNRSLRISVADYGAMVFQLFEELAPNTTGRIIELAQDGFYEDVIFHRVIDDFMIQAGDPTGTGSGGSGLGDIDDEFHELLMHTVPGMISMAKSSDDTGDSQFFITEIATRWLDFDYSVFGFQTDGEDVRDAISEVAVDTTDRPTTDVVIESIDVFTDTQRGVLVLSAPEGYTGTATVTVTVDDGNGGTAQRQFDVQVVEDTSEYADSNPWLGDMDPIETVSGEAGNSQIPAFDIEGDDIYYAGIVDPENEDIELLVDAATGEVNWQTSADVVGIHGLFLGVREFGGTSWDTQAVPLFVAPAAPSVDLLAASDTGISDTDDITNLNNASASDILWFRVSDVVPGAEVYLYAGDQLVGRGTAVADTLTIVTGGDFELSDGVHSIRARQVFSDEADIGNQHYAETFTSDFSDAVAIIVDTSDPEITSTPDTSTLPAGALYEYDVQSDEEAAGNVRYRLDNSPAGMTIDAETGVLSWTPPGAATGPFSVSVVVSDLAGNEGSQDFELSVNLAPVFESVGEKSVVEGNLLEFALVATDDDGGLEYRLAEGAPDGAAIDAMTGVFAWTPSEEHGPYEHFITVEAVDAFGSVGQTTFKVNVSEDNTPPVLDPIVAITVDSGDTATFTATATDADVPAQTIYFGLGSEAPAGAVINPDTGVFSWVTPIVGVDATFTFDVVAIDSLQRKRRRDGLHHRAPAGTHRAAGARSAIGPVSVDEHHSRHLHGDGNRRGFASRCARLQPRCRRPGKARSSIPTPASSPGHRTKRTARARSRLTSW